MNTWFTIKVKYIKQLEDGRLKSVTEPYLIDSVSFTDAEARIYEEVGQHVRGEFIIKGISRVDYADIFYYDDSDDWYKCKLTYIAVDADGEGKEKKISSNFLVTANSVKEAYDRIKESLSEMTVSFEVPSIMLTNIVDVIPYDPENSAVPERDTTNAKISEEEVFEGTEFSESDEFNTYTSSDEEDDDIESEEDEVDEDNVTLEDKTED